MKHIQIDSSEQSMSHAFKAIISNLYSTPFYSSIREILSNAYDAARKGSKKVSINVNCNYPNRYISIRDEGLGISEEEMETLYRVAFKSSKRDDSSQIGSFGIGRFAPLSYTNTFQLNTWVNGYKYSYVIGFDDELPYYELEEKKESNLPNGTEVILPFPSEEGYEHKSGELRRFIKTNTIFVKDVNTICNYYKADVKDTNLDDTTKGMVNCTTAPVELPISETTSYQLYSNGAVDTKKQFSDFVAVVTNGIYYPLNKEFHDIFLKNGNTKTDLDYFNGLNPQIPVDVYVNPSHFQLANVILFVPSKEVDFPTNRESISSTAKSYNAIKKAYLALSRDFVRTNTYNFQTPKQLTNFRKFLNYEYRSFLTNIQCLKFKNFQIKSISNKQSWIFNTEPISSLSLVYTFPAKFRQSQYENAKGTIYYANPDVSSLPHILTKLSDKYLTTTDFCEGYNLSSLHRSHASIHLDELVNTNFIFYYGKRKLKTTNLLNKLNINPDNWHGFIVRYENEDFDLNHYPHLINLSSKGIINIVDAGDLRKVKTNKKKQSGKKDDINSTFASKQIVLIKNGLNKNTLFSNGISLPNKYYYIYKEDENYFNKFFSNSLIVSNDLYIIPSKYKDQVGEDCDHWLEVIKYSIEKQKERFLNAYGIKNLNQQVTQLLFALISDRTIQNNLKVVLLTFAECLREHAANTQNNNLYTKNNNLHFLDLALRDAGYFTCEQHSNLTVLMDIKSKQEETDFIQLINSDIGIAKFAPYGKKDIVWLLMSIYGLNSVSKIEDFLYLVFHYVKIDNAQLKKTIVSIIRKLLSSR